MRYFLVLVFSGDGYGDSKCWFRVWTYKNRADCERALISKFCVLLCELTKEDVHDYPSVV